MSSQVKSFKDLVLAQSRDPSLSANATLAINGRDLTIADVVAVSRGPAPVKVTSESINAIKACSKIIPNRLAKGDQIHGVNTGFGGSADTRSDDIKKIQQSLITHQTCGIVADSKQKPVNSSNGHSRQSNGEVNGSKKHSEEKQQRAARTSLPLNDPLAATCMPESWARMSMLIRLNSLARGVSGIRVDIAECLMKLLNKDIVPRIPMRGSISAPGDLSALAWISALMEGKSCATATIGPRGIDEGRKVIKSRPRPIRGGYQTHQSASHRGIGHHQRYGRVRRGRSPCDARVSQSRGAIPDLDSDECRGTSRQ